jgi:hypothetical protein
MRLIKVSSALVAICLVGFVAASAEEGMWQLDKLDKKLVRDMKKLGLELSRDEIYTPDGEGIAYAIVDLGGGTGSFVSEKGLILTNHHVAFTALQRASSVESNFMREGFYAETHEEEVPAKGYEASVLISIEDVTDEVLKAAEGLEGAERYQAIENKIKEIINEAEKDRDVRCRVSSFYGGMQYKLFTYFTMKDVRIVYAPPSSVGNYGGDIDNWMWPRHGGDFSFFRAYVAPDGSSAEYSEDNVPYQPEVCLTISSKGVKEGDFTMIIGYPASTMRYRSSYSIAYHQNWMYPKRIRVFGEMIDLFKRESERDPSTAIKVASFDQMLNNAMKNYQGMLEGFEKADLLANKRLEEQEFTEWLEDNPDMKEKYGDIFPSIGTLYDGQEEYREKAFVMRFCGFGCQMLRAANTLARWSKEKTKDDLERDPGYMERDIPRLKRGLKTIQMSYDEHVDREVIKYFLEMSQALPSNQRVEAFDSLLEASGGDDMEAKIDNAADNLYSGTSLGTVDERLRVFELPREEVMQLEDPFIRLALDLDSERRALEERDEEFAGAISAIRPELIKAYKKWKGGAFYPDANSTMRLTYGTVKGYWPVDAIYYDYITSLGGMVEKDTGEDPFDCPEKILDIYQMEDYGNYRDEYLNDVPVDFLATCDITGGNSGSPIMNDRGEIIGAAFDGNYESISADYIFDEGLTRCINVDSRYILFIIDKFSGASKLLDEMTIH